MTDMKFYQFNDQYGIQFQYRKVYVAGSALGQDQFQDRYGLSVRSGVGSGSIPRPVCFLEPFCRYIYNFSAGRLSIVVQFVGVQMCFNIFKMSGRYIYKYYNS